MLAHTFHLGIYESNKVDRCARNIDKRLNIEPPLTMTGL